MKEVYKQVLAAIDSQQEAMLAATIALCECNSGTTNTVGVERVGRMLASHFASLQATVILAPMQPAASCDSSGRLVQTPLAPSLLASKKRRRNVLLAAHLDTVYAAEHPFQMCTRLSPDKLRGPGVADIKGGIVVMLAALRAFEASPFAEHLGWTVVLNSEEEIGSPASRALYAEAAIDCECGLIFEPSLPDGALIKQRKGSANFAVVVRGKSAHVGRDFAAGRHAIYALGDLLAFASTQTTPELTVNVGKIAGGTTVNSVPDLATMHFNLRFAELRDREDFLRRLAEKLEATRQKWGVAIELHTFTQRSPKPFDVKHMKLFAQVLDCGRDLGLKMDLKDSGGVCDGNTLAELGLPCVDTMGVRGQFIHSGDEELVIESLVERAKLAALFLMRLAARDFEEV